MQGYVLREKSTWRHTYRDESYWQARSKGWWISGVAGGPPQRGGEWAWPSGPGLTEVGARPPLLFMPSVWDLPAPPSQRDFSQFWQVLWLLNQLPSLIGSCFKLGVRGFCAPGQANSMWVPQRYALYCRATLWWGSCGSSHFCMWPLP